MSTTEAAIEEQTVHFIDAATNSGVAAVLQPGESATIYSGAVPATFKVNLIGTIQRDAEMVITADGSAVATLTFNSRSTIVNGEAISIANRGRNPQGFVANLVD